MKLRRIGILFISLACCSAHVHAVESSSKEGEREAGVLGIGEHRGRLGGGDDDHGHGSGGGSGSGAQSNSASSDATVQAIVDYCSSVDGSHRSEYAKLGNWAVGTNGRKGADEGYQQTYENVSASLQNVAPGTGVATCKAGIARLIAK